MERGRRATGPRITMSGTLRHRIHLDDNLEVLRDLPDESVDLIYIDPPFNTRKRQSRTRIRTARNPEGDRVGFGGERYQSTVLGTLSFDDAHSDFLGFLEPRLQEARRVLARHASLYFHIDYREVHYCKVVLDGIFGRSCFLNEIIWSYDFGGRTRQRWAPKHDNILVYVKDPKAYHFDPSEVDRIPYLAPGLVGPEKAKRGKLPTDSWWSTIVPTAGKERTGYPTQKPLQILRRVVSASSRPGDLVVDFFAGSGTTGAACLESGRRFLLVDNNPAALQVMAERFGPRDDIEWVGYSPEPRPDVGASSIS